MTHVATLVAPRPPWLDRRLVARITARLPRAGAPAWLEEAVAADIFFTLDDAGPDLRALVADLRAEAGSAPVDIFVQPSATRRKKLLVADMDSTMIGEECLDELADCLGIGPEFARITEAAMRGDIAFEPALRERVRLLSGLDVSAIETILAERISLTPGGRALVATMRAHGAVTALVSSGLTAFTEPVAARLGFDKVSGNVLIVENGKCSGRLAEPIFGQDAKRQMLERLRNEYRVAPEETLAVGDGANDLGMLAVAGLGVAYHGKPIVAAAAKARIDHCDLNALLYAQGFSRKDFCE